VLLILVAVVLLVLGLIDGSSALLISSIAVSLLAAVVLVVGARQAAAARAETDLGEEPEAEYDRDESRTVASGGTASYASAGATARASGHRTAVRESSVALADPPSATVPTQAGGPPSQAAGPRYGPDPVGYERPEWDQPASAAENGRADSPSAAADDAEYDDEEDPPDEPAPQAVSPADAARVARLSTEVLVIDGRPRYHLPGCVHLLGRESEPLPVSEAVELGFTPCSLCEPDKALLTEARRA
jgi:hypothetical protein